jgi:biopolymer transport protein ExbD
MPNYEPSLNQQQRPILNLIPLIDILFFTLIFFMTIAAYNQMESEINISVPKSETAKEIMRSAGEVIINVTTDGKFVVNQKTLTVEELDAMLVRVSSLFPDQPVIIRADENTIHRHIVRVLDACAKANIWDISFAAMTEKN